MNEGVFKERYLKLNKKQREAVDTIDGPVMVIAGPGTGKTTILALRIANILRKTDTPGSAILALTFTDAGARSMKEKLRGIIGERVYEIPVHTFHGFAHFVISEFADHFPGLSRSTQITDIESEAMIREILKQKEFSKLRPLGDPDFYVGKIIDAIGDCKQEAWTPQIIDSFAREEIERIKNNESSISKTGKSKGMLKGESLKMIERCERTQLFAQVYDKYEKRKQEERKIDFDDLIFGLVEAMRHDKLLLQLLQEKYLYILIDEHQDTNDSQNLVIKYLADFFDSPNLFIVGDEKQAIYRFQGASIENFLRLRQSWGNIKVIPLENNYRSHQKILDATYQMIEKNYKESENLDLRVRLKSKESGIKPIEIIGSPDTETEEKEIASRIKEIQREYPEKTIAVILRKNSEVSRVMNFLSSMDISATAERGTNIFEHPFGRVFFSLIDFLLQPDRLESLALTFPYGLWGLPFEKQIPMIKFARSGNIKEIGDQIPQIEKLLSDAARLGPLEYLSHLANLSGLDRMAAANPMTAEVWGAIYDLAKDTVRSCGIEDPRALLSMLLSYRKSAERKTIKIKTGKVDSKVSVLTAHGSKGLEYDFVFTPFATEEYWMSRNRGAFFILPRDRGSEDDEKDERRLFYVALTRAKEHVVISYSERDSLDKPLTPLRFIGELDQNSVSKIHLKSSAKNNLNKKENFDRLTERETEKIEYTKRALLENGLSVTALNHFVSCPMEFYYKSILKLPDSPSASSEKGNAMHESISRVWSALHSKLIPTTLDKRKGESGDEVNKIKSILISSIREYFKKSLLPKLEKDAAAEELISNAPLVARALINHFKQPGKVYTENWVEAHLDFKVHKETINLKIHGRLDSVIENGDDLLVFDYKTTEGKSENEIKGLTKNSKGDYFRQLVFYSILLQNSHRFKNKKASYSLVFIKPNKSGQCPTVTLSVSKSDREEVLSQIQRLLDSVWSGDLFSSRCFDRSCKFCTINNPKA
jgi:DNA helicase-2/ATP-dependent DNA helicase PcrA